MVKLIIFFLFFNAVNISSARTLDYYNFSFTGQKDFNLYDGPLDPRYKFNYNSIELDKEDDVYYKRFIDDKLGEDFFALEEFWSKVFSEQSSCPTFYLEKSISYIRYLYRLVTISYLMEAMKSYYKMIYQLRLDTKKCGISYDSIFSKCRPKSREMIKFVHRVQYRYLLNFKSEINKKYSEVERKAWLKGIVEKSVNPKGNIALNKVYQSCKNCSQLNFNDIEEILTRSCKENTASIHMICSELDDLYGISTQPIATNLILASHVMRIVNSGSFGKACLERFVKIMSPREREYPQFKDLFEIVSDSFDKKKGTETGQIFIPGALKEFDDKGLSDFLFVPPAPKTVLKPKVKVVATKVKKVPKKLPRKIIPKVIERPKPLPKPAIIPIVKVSAFEAALKKFSENKMKISDVDMIKFKKDFVFSKNSKDKFSKILKFYQTRKILEGMKKYEGLGTFDEPLRLIFLKFLIDKKMHQGLWNITSVIGEKFFVINDIDDKKGPIFIKLHNSESTKHRWQISIVDK